MTTPNPLDSGTGFPAANRDGTPALVGPDDYTRDVILSRIAPKTVTVVGNLADLHRSELDTIPHPDGVSATTTSTSTSTSSDSTKAASKKP